VGIRKKKDPKIYREKGVPCNHAGEIIVGGGEAPTSVLGNRPQGEQKNPYLEKKYPKKSRSPKKSGRGLKRNQVL